MCANVRSFTSRSTNVLLYASHVNALQRQLEVSHKLAVGHLVFPERVGKQPFKFVAFYGGEPRYKRGQFYRLVVDGLSFRLVHTALQK